MVDLFGKKKLEDRILELEAARAKLEREKEELMRTLEKREEKIRKLASANQEANLALKASGAKNGVNSGGFANIRGSRRVWPGKAAQNMEAQFPGAGYAHAETQSLPLSQRGSPGCLLSRFYA